MVSQVFCDYSILFNLYNIGKVSYNWIGTNSLEEKIRNEKFTVVYSRCHQNLSLVSSHTGSCFAEYGKEMLVLNGSCTIARLFNSNFLIQFECDLIWSIDFWLVYLWHGLKACCVHMRSLAPFWVFTLLSIICSVVSYGFCQFFTFPEASSCRRGWWIFGMDIIRLQKEAIPEVLVVFKVKMSIL